MKRHTYNRRGSYGKCHQLTERQSNRVLSTPMYKWHKRSPQNIQHNHMRNDQYFIRCYLGEVLNISRNDWEY